MRHHRLRRPPSRSPDPARQPSAPRVSRLRLGRDRGHRRVRRRHHHQEHPQGRRARPPGRHRRPAVGKRRHRAHALGDARRVRRSRTRIRIRTAPDAFTSSTTASSRTTASFAPSSWLAATSFSAKPTPRSFRISSRMSTAGTSPLRCAARSTACRVRAHWWSSPRINRIASSVRASTRRSSSGSVAAKCS